MKFRIVEIISDSGSKDRKRNFVIERRGWLRWKQVCQTEVFSKEIKFATYDETEEYLLRNYTGHGECTRIGCVYRYQPYSYY